MHSLAGLDDPMVVQAQPKGCYRLQPVDEGVLFYSNSGTVPLDILIMQKDIGMPVE